MGGGLAPLQGDGACPNRPVKLSWPYTFRKGDPYSYTGLAPSSQGTSSRVLWAGLAVQGLPLGEFGPRSLRIVAAAVGLVLRPGSPPPCCLQHWDCKW